MNIVGKLLAGNLSVLLGAGLCIGFAAAQQSDAALQALTEVGGDAISQRAFAQLETVRAAKVQQIEGYFATIRAQLETEAESRMVVEAAIHFRESFETLAKQLEVDEAGLAAARSKMSAYYAERFLRPEAFAPNAGLRPGYAPPAPEALLPASKDGLMLQTLYLHDEGNPSAPDAKGELVMNGAAVDYNWWHAVYHPPLRKLLTAFGYAEIFLIEPEAGVVIYSVNKRPELGTSLLEGPFKESNLARAVKASIDAGREGKRGFVSVVDFEAYEPDHNAPASFIAAPVFQGDDVVGVLAFQMPVDAINAVMTFNGKWADVGLGTSGETYMVAQDGTMRSPARGGSGRRDVLRRTVDTEATRKALAGETGTTELEGEGGAILSAYAPLEIPGLRYALVAEMKRDEAMAARDALVLRAGEVSRGVLLTNMAVMVLVLLVGGGLTHVFVRSVVGPIRRMIVDINAMVSQRDLTARIEVASQDEVGELSAQLNDFIEAVQRSVLEIKEMSEAVDDGAGRMRSTARDLEASSGVLSRQAQPISSAVQHVSSTVHAMAASAERSTSSVGSVARETDTVSGSLRAVASGSEEISAEVNQVSAAIEEMGATLQEVSKQTAKAAQVASDALSASRGASDNMASLGAAAREVGKVVEVITAIAEQTKLLALNATIEAASAGDAGRGFAVVASEVKNLAQQTASATEQIRSRIQAIQAETQAAVGGIRQVAEVVEEVNAISMTIAAAVEEQSATVAEIGRATAAAAARTRNISDEVGSASGGARQVANDVEELARTSEAQAHNAQETASAVRGIADSVSAMAKATADTVVSANDVSAVAGTLAEASSRLRQVVGLFRVS